MAINTAIIGLGIMGQRMVAQMARHPGYNVSTLWDPAADACRAAHHIAPDATVAATAEEAMAGADLVYLACPPVPRKAYALAAAAQGSAVFLEKPLRQGCLRQLTLPKPRALRCKVLWTRRKAARWARSRG